MPRKTKKERFAGEHFIWLLSRRDGVYQADGRGNRPGLGRHSLGTRDRAEALRELRRLDQEMAVRIGRIAAAPTNTSAADPLPLERGQAMYLEFVGRPPSQGGASAKTVARYRAVLDKFLPFARGRGVHIWNRVDAAALRAYGAALDKDDYHPRTQSFELAVLKSAVKWLAEERHIPAVDMKNCRAVRPKGTSTYCYSSAEVVAMVERCHSDPALHWMRDVIVVLSATGMRIGELAALRWDDVDLGERAIDLKDTRLLVRPSDRGDARRTKSKRDRRIPLHQNVVAVLRRLSRLEGGFVFLGPRGGRLKPDTVLRILKRDVLEPLATKFPKAGDRDIRRGKVHSFRHFFCSQGADGMTSELMLKEWLGHANGEMVGHYYHARDAQALEQIDRLPSLLETIDLDQSRSPLPSAKSDR